MVEFYDTIQKKNIHYHIDKKLAKKWVPLRGTIIKKDEDRVYIVDGRERVGKSLWTMQQAKYINPNFSIEDICFTPDEFLNRIRHAPKGSVIIFDEAFRGLSSKGSQSKVNKKIVQAMMEMGQRNLVVFIVLPTFFLLELYAAVLRSEALFHIYKSKDGKRAFRIYTYKKKSLLYYNGKKKGFSYSKPRVKPKGRFYNIYPINEKEYRKRKRKSLMEMEKIQEEEIEDKFEQRNILLWILNKNFKLSGKKIEKICNEKGISLKQRTIYQSIRKITGKKV